MAAEGWHLGGESSGHIICSDVTTTGDGIVAALQVLQAVRAAGRPLSELAAGMNRLPQRLVNVRREGSVALEGNGTVAAAVAAAEAELGDAGRVLLRPSGTEPVVRVMVEGRDAAQVEALCERLAEEVARGLA
jgi:phosphoglucosamine mutase